MPFSKTLEYLQIQENSAPTSHSLECTENLHHHSQVYKTRKNFRKHQCFWFHYKRQGYDNFGRFDFTYVYVLHKGVCMLCLKDF